MTNTRLQTVVTGLVAELSDLAPDASIEISYQPYETEDADILVNCPDSMPPEVCDRLTSYAAERSSTILLADGFSIVVMVFEPQERVQAEVAAYRAALVRKAS